MIYLVYRKSSQETVAVMKRAYKKLKPANHYANRKNSDTSDPWGEYFVVPVAVRSGK